MRVHIIHHGGRAWPMPKNHLDRRVCPDCGVTVHGSQAQTKHHERHLKEEERDSRVVGWLVELAKRCGITEEEVASHIGQDWSWGAEVTGTEAEIEAAE